MKTIEIKTIPVILTGIFSFSNHPEVDYENSPVLSSKEKPVDVTMRLSLPNDFTSSIKRVYTDTHKNEIHNAYVFAFKAGVLSYVKRVEKMTNAHDEKFFRVALKASLNPADTYKLMIVANAREWILPLIGNNHKALDGKYYSEIQVMLKQTGISNPLFSSGGPVAMWGELPYVEIKGSKKTFSISMIRSIARIDVGLGATDYHPITHMATWGNLSNFSLEEVHLYRPNNGIAFIPLSGNYDVENKIITRPTPVGTHDTSHFTYPVTGGTNIINEIYTPEANIKICNSGVSGDENHLRRMAIVVKGSYNGNPSGYYRIDFINSKNELVDVLRNHLYQFNIKAVYDNGFRTPDEAYQSVSINMDVEMTKWNDDSMGEIAFDGQHILSVSQGEFTLPRNKRTNEDTDNKLDITTDYPSGWVIDDITNTPDEESEPTEWLTVSKQTGNVTEKTTISLLTWPNTTDADRTAYVHVKAGCLCYSVKVIQTTSNEINVSLKNGRGVDVNELLFRSHVSESVPAQVLNVAWLPKSANPDVSKFTVDGVSEFDFGSGYEIFEGQIVDMNGHLSYTIHPPAMTQKEVDTDPFLEKASRFDFTVDNNDASETKSIVISQKNYAAIPVINDEYIMNGLEQNFTITANTPWKIEIENDPDCVIDELFTVAGGFNDNKISERVYFKPVNGYGKSSSSVVFRVNSTDPVKPFSGFKIKLDLIPKNVYSATKY